MLKNYTYLWFLIAWLCWLYPQTMFATNSPYTAKIGFIENKGQILDQYFRPNAAVRYLQNGDGLNVQLRQNGFSYDIFEAVAPKNAEDKTIARVHRVDIELLGANPNAQISADSKSADYLNYYNEYGAFEHIYTYRRVFYRDIYPNIDLEFVVDSKNRVKYNFIVRAGGDVSKIQLQYNGATATELKNKAIALQTSITELNERVPRSYQPTGGDVEVAYRQISANIYGFVPQSDYDKNATLIIDPLPDRNWGTYYGDTGDDQIYHLEKTTLGNAIFAMGRTTSTGNIATAGAYQTAINSGEDLFVVRMATNGSRVWGTYYGGTSTPEQGGSIAVDGLDNIYMATTTGSDGLATIGVHQDIRFAVDMLIVKLNSAGVRQWATYYGGGGTDETTTPSSIGGQSNSIAVNQAGTFVYVVGSTTSTNQIAGGAAGRHQSTFGMVKDAFVAKLNAGTSARVWGTYYGGASFDEGLGIALGTNDTVYICGRTLSSAAIASTGAYDVALGGTNDGFIVKFNPNNGSRSWATYYGGSAIDDLFDIAIDGSNNVIATGYTTSTIDIATAGAHKTVLGDGSGSGRDAYIVKFTRQGQRVWGTYYGGAGLDEAYELMYNSGAIYIAGRTASIDAIATVGAFKDTKVDVDDDAFLAKFNDNGILQWGTYYGGADGDQGQGITTDATGAIYLGGATLSNTNIATTGGAVHLSTYAGPASIYDGFIVQFSECSISAAITAATNAACGNNNGTATVTGTGGTLPYTYLWSIGSQSNATATGLTGGSYTVTVTDASGCPATASVTITQPTNTLTTTLSSTNASCNGGTNGTATAVVSGGTSPYTYLWTGNRTTSTITGLSAGTYNLTVTDNAGCTNFGNVTVTAPSAITATLSNTNVSCNGGTNGTAIAVVNGGTSPYTYLWTGNRTTSNITGLSAGTYNLTVTDNAGCTAFRSVTVTAPSAITATLSNTNVSCNSGTNGTATAVVNGGTSPYTYLWTGNRTTSNITGLSAGTYNLTVTDNAGCTAFRSVTVTAPSAITATLSNTNASCNGGTNGTATAVVNGGTSPYTYLWTGNRTTSNITGLSAGTYNLTVTDNAGCTAFRSVTVTAPSAITATLSNTNASCNGGTNGTATAVVSGGTSPYTYLWTGNRTTSNITGLSAGTYNLTVTDNAGCTAFRSVTVTAPSAITATLSNTNASCNGGTNGTATAVVSGGTSPYTYLWTGNRTTSNITGLSAGTYNLTVTDNAGCTNFGSVSISQPSALTLSMSSVQASCGLSNGSATLSTTGGTSPYSFLWSNSRTTAANTGLSAGVYTVTVTDNAGCTNSNSVTVTAPSGLTVSTSSTNVTCNGGTNGTATAVVSGGTSPYTYLWTGNRTTSNITGLSAGTYNLTVTDNAGCTNFGSVSISQPSALTLSMSSVQASCGLSNGSSTVSTTGGTSPYSFLWSNGRTTAANTGLSAGVYTVTVTDNAGCTNSNSVTVTAPSGLTVSTSSTNVTCNGGTNGTATAVVSGGTSPYTYLWTGNRTTSNITGLSAGTYNLTVTDNAGCTAFRSVTVTAPSAITATLSNTNASCNGGTNGTATAVVSGGTSPYTYLWTGNRTTSNITGLSAGTYNLTVTDNAGCTNFGSVTISQPSALTLSMSSVQASCGSSNGSATISTTGGTSPYSFLWSNGRTTAANIGLSAGVYTVTVTDNAGCTNNNSVTVTAPSGLTVITSSTNVTCNGGTNGTATAVVSGGTSPYTYLWTGNRTTSNITGLSAGTYNLTVTDNAGCTAFRSVTVTAPSAITATLSNTNASCNGGTNGTATAVVSGGTSPYTYLWTGNRTTSNITGLSAGTYNLTVTDNAGCTNFGSVTISQPSALTLSMSSVQASCGSSNGSATISTTGGTSPYSFLWSNGRTTAANTGLSAGVYTVTVTDNAGCTNNNSVTVTAPSGLTVSTSSTNVTCNGGTNGTATAVVSGGTSPYSYLWTGNRTTSNITGLSASTYNLTVTDNAGCTAFRSVTVTAPSAITATLSNTNASCNGGTNGTATAVVSGGTSPYTYLWTGNRTTSNITGLSAGTYNLTVTDNAGCTNFGSVTISQPSALTLSMSSVQASCGSSNGSATISTTGGTSPYSFLWSNGRTTAANTGLSAGVYTVTVTDNAGCTNNNSVTVTAPSGLTVSTSSTNVTCNGGTNGTATAVVSGGTSPYTYLWTGNRTTSNITGLSASTYNLTVTDNAGCTNFGSVSISQPSALTLSMSSVQASCGSSNGSATISTTGGTSPYSFLWSNGRTTTANTGLSAGVYTVTVTDNAGCTNSNSVTVTAPSGLTVSTSSTNVTCNGGTNGTATAVVSGGTSPYTYLWTGNRTTSNITGLSAGTYNLTVTDNAGCTNFGSVTISQPSALTLSMSSVQASCGLSNGSSTVSTTGGTLPYSFLWSNGRTTAANTGLSAGVYTVTVTDNAGCTNSNSVTVTAPSGLTVSTSSTNVTCNGGTNGTATAVVSGGTSPYSYLWTGNRTTSNITGLSAGTYNLTVTDNAGCTNFGSVTISQPSALTLSMSSVQASCGLSNGSSTVSTTGGTSPYSFLWSNGRTTAANTGLSAGVYTVTVTDNAGCTNNNSVTVTAPSGLTVSTSSTNATCNGGTNGTATAVVSGGTSPYTYLWTGNRTTSNITGLSAGTYNLTVTDNAGCTNFGSVTISQPSALTLSMSSVQASCGLSNGSSTVSTTGGTSPYSFLWSNGRTTAANTGLSAGVYTVTVTDNAGCTNNNSVTVTAPSGLTVSTSSTNATCNGGTNGTATAVVSGGTSPYTYLWTGNRTTSNITGLSAGTYNLTVTDNAGCTNFGSVTISQPSALTLSMSSVQASCGLSNGSATVSTTGGTSPYSFLWSNGRTTAANTGLSAGVYTVTVTDNAGCTNNNSVTVTAPSGLTVSTSSTNVTCNGGTNGTATAVVSGGTSPYSYLWTGNRTTSNITGLSAGTYNLTVTDNAGCTNFGSVTISQPSALTPNISTVSIGCGSGGTGSATANPSGGTSPYSFIWSNGRTTASNTGLTVGTYGITITDNAGCIITSSANIVTTTGSSISVSFAISNTNCFAGNDGSATAIASGGSTPYSYTWSNGRNTAVNSGLTSGTYTVTATDNAGCSSIAVVTITQPSPVNAPLSTDNITCFGGNNGSILSAASGGTAPYTYLWSNGRTTSSITGLIAGGYALTVTDALGCRNVKVANLSQPNPITVSFSNNNATCAGLNNGIIAASVVGGIQPYNFLWSNGETSSTINNLAPNVYTLSLTDANSCITVTSTTISAPSALSITSSSTGVSCNTNSDGTATVVVTGGSQPYVYQWQNGNNNSTATNLATGIYSVTVTDNNNCPIATAVTISGVSITLSTTTTNVSCGGGSDGSAFAQATGGTAPYQYQWSNATTGAFATNLSVGFYVVTATDASGCNSNIATITLTEPTAIATTISAVGVTCVNCTDGSASATVSGGTAPYTFAWSSGSTNSNIASLGLGTYFLTVQDANGCTNFATANITLQTSITQHTWAENIQVYPNPTANILHIDGLPEGTALQLIDVSGRVLKNIEWRNISTNTTLQIDYLVPGVYFLQLQNDSQRHTIRIIKTE